VLAFFLNVSPGWLDTMKIQLVEGRDLRVGDLSPGAAVVNEAFARQFFENASPLGKFFAKGASRYQVVGVVRDAPYRSIREGILPVAYVPFDAVDTAGAAQPVREASFIVRTSAPNPMTLASTLRRSVPGARAGFRVSNVRSQADLVRAQTVRERLLAMLALFFAGVALLLAGIGLYGVLDYTVLQRRREIGIRMAIGAQPGEIARRVTADVFRMVLAGALGGLGLGLASIRYLSALLYDVKAGDPVMLAIPCAAIVAAAILAAMPAVLRAVSIDPVTTLRSE
jgi:predicted lysophospholipase L1 biosynthesis ABC-type transport system permease subunit